MANSNEQVTAMIMALTSPRKEICEQLRAMIATKFPMLEEKWRWSRPVYGATKGYVCHYIANQHDVNLGFEQGAHLNDPKGLLSGTGKNMRHIKIQTVAMMDLGYYEQLLAQAIRIADAQQAQSEPS